MAKKYYLAPQALPTVAYGSNLNVQQMRYRCPDAKAVGTAEIEDYELLFKGSKTGSYLTIEKKTDSKVPVAVWEVSESDERRLDAYEGYPDFYYKTEMEIRMKSFETKRKRKIKAFVYIMHEDRNLGIPSLVYVRTCLDGYREFGFDGSYIHEAIDRSREEL